MAFLQSILTEKGANNALLLFTNTILVLLFFKQNYPSLFPQLGIANKKKRLSNQDSLKTKP